MVMGVGIDDHGDVAFSGEAQDFRAGVGGVAGLEPSGGVEFDGTAMLLQNIQNSGSVGEVGLIVDDGKFFREIEVSEKEEFSAFSKTVLKSSKL